MSLKSYVKSLCTPAYVYLVMSVISLVMIMLQNAGNTTEYCAGNFACDVSSTGIVLAIHGLYIMFWTFVSELDLQGWIQKSLLVHSSTPLHPRVYFDRTLYSESRSYL